MEELLVRWGAVAVLAGAALEGDATVILAGVVAHLGPWGIVAARFLYGTRVASMIFWGMQALPVPRFLAYDVLACAAWSAAFVGLGYGLSGSVSLILGELRRAEEWLAGALLVAVLVVLALRRVAAVVRPACRRARGRSR